MTNASDWDYNWRLYQDSRIPQSIRDQVFKELLKDDKYRLHMNKHMLACGWKMLYDLEGIFCGYEKTEGPHKGVRIKK